MSRAVTYLACLVAAVTLGVTMGACHPEKTPELRVLGVHDSQVVFVQVTNPESRPMRLTKLEYTFAAAGTTVSQGEVPLERDVPAESAIVLEVPLEGDVAASQLTLQGKLTGEIDQIVRTFNVSAQIQAQQIQSR